MNTYAIKDSNHQQAMMAMNNGYVTIVTYVSEGIYGTTYKNGHLQTRHSPKR